MKKLIDIQSELKAPKGQRKGYKFNNAITDELKEYIKKYFTIDNGEITRKDRKGGNGSLDKDGYLIIKVKGRQIKSHRLAWFLYYGEFPNGQIDHLNRNRTDNRKENLRIATSQQQNLNKKQKPNKDTGCIGIYLDRTHGLKKRYAFSCNGKTYRFYTLKEAEKGRKQCYQNY